MIKLWSPAKINLRLSVLGKRPDGYHEVEMLMQMVGLYDEITVSLGNTGIDVICDDVAVPSGDRNIAWRAAQEMLRASGRKDGISITIKKIFPLQPDSPGGAEMLPL